MVARRSSPHTWCSSRKRFRFICWYIFKTEFLIWPSLNWSPKILFFFLQGKSRFLFLQFKAFSPNAFGNSDSLSSPQPSPSPPSPQESGGTEAAPDLLSQQLVTSECTLAIKMLRLVSGGRLVTLCPAAAHRTDELPAKGSAFSPSYSLAAVTEFACFLSCTFQDCSLCYKSSFIPISCNLHFWYF